MQRSKSLALIFLVGTLVVGGTVGFTADRMLTRSACQNPTDRKVLRQYLADRLELSNPQRSAVDSILDGRNREMNRIMAPVKSQLDSVRNVARAQIMKLLAPQQQAEFQKMIDESKRREEAERK